MKKSCIAMLLAGGQGSRLYALTQDVAKPNMPFGGKYRIIDFPLSNCANSDGKIYDALLCGSAAAEVHRNKADLIGADMLYIARAVAHCFKLNRCLRQQRGVKHCAPVALLPLNELR